MRFIQAIQTTFPPHRLQSECCELDGWSWTEGFQRRVKAVACSTLAGICITLTQPAWSAGKNIIEMPKLSWRMALSMASEAVAVCQDRGISVTATVIDSAGLRQAVVKGDSVGPHSLSLSYRKAFTAFAVADALEVNTTSEILKTGKMNAGSPALNTDPDLIFLAGGVAIHGHGKTLLGAIGVSGAPSGLTDEGCAAAALAKYQSEID
ncbi:hypothetical protein CAL12_20995 [Bordetella genomosp. 8]|uniref:Heme-binding protein n=1 Tax=Bordetella genomosp. 8 TaxID=1416806 RepID=A0A1W6YPV8_9BORD|nr:hypothetical protein CAL12_20995 [Bordetella genomosp. 8]